MAEKVAYDINISEKDSFTVPKDISNLKYLYSFKHSELTVQQSKISFEARKQKKILIKI